MKAGDVHAERDKCLPAFLLSLSFGWVFGENAPEGEVGPLCAGGKLFVIVEAK
jgi:hypothetical protein